MKISKITNKSLFLLVSFMLAGLFASCGTTTTAVPEETAPKVEEPAPVAPVEPEPKIEEPAPVIAEPVVENPVVDDEYSRSVGNVQVSRDTFAEDKEAVLRIISELANIMKDSNSDQSYRAWLGYVEQDSIDYWKLRKNLQKAQKRLPANKNAIVLKLNTIQDYFKQVFVPSRRGREVNEIRYVSDKYIKAVQVEEGRDDMVFYYFVKVNSRWMVHLPTNEELN